MTVPAVEQLKLATEDDAFRLPIGDVPTARHELPSSGRMPVHEKTPSTDELAVHVAADALPTYSGLVSISSCATTRSLALGATFATCSPPPNVTVMLALGPVAVQFAARKVMFVDMQAVGPTASLLLRQPLVTVPDGQSVQLDTLTAQEEPLRLAA